METKLDSLKIIKNVDKSNILKLLTDFPKQCQDAKQIGEKFRVESGYRNIKKIVITGMGGSAISGDLLRVYLKNRITVPFIVNRDSNLPAFIDNETLIFVNSYSGNTEETINAYQDAVKNKAKVIVITSGGKLKTFSEQNNNSCLLIPQGLLPRTSLGYLFFPMMMILNKIGILKNNNEAISETLNLLENLSEEMNPERQTSHNYAKQLALRLYKRVPVIYGANEQNGIVALRWRNQFNENSKTFAVSNVFPELIHNEIVGWETLVDLTKNFYIIILKDEDTLLKIKRSIDITEEVIKDKVGAIEQIQSRGNSLLARLFSLIVLGDFVSVYLAILYDIDPTPIKAIDYLKNELTKD